MPLFQPSQSSFASHANWVQRSFFHKGSSALWSFTACSGMSVGKQTALIGAAVNRVGLVTDLRTKFQELVAPDAAFGFGAGSIIGVYIHPLTDDYYAIVDSAGTGELARSQDGGVTWTDVTPPGLIAEGAQMIGITSSSTGRIWCQNSANAFGVNPDLFYSDDDGATWTDLISNSFATTHVPVDVSPDGKTLIILHGTQIVQKITDLDLAVPTYLTIDTGLGTNGIGLLSGTPTSVALIQRKNSLWNNDGTIFFGSADNGNYWYTTDDFLTFNELLIENLVNRPGSVNGTVEGAAVYSSIHGGFFHINRTNNVVMFLPEDDMENSIALTHDDAAINPIVSGMIDGDGDIAFPTGNGEVISPLLNNF